MDKIEWVNKLRRSELDLVIPFLIKRAKILEIGAGTGYQANILRELGYNVVPIDLALDLRTSAHSRLHAEYSKLNIVEYDGENIPFPDSHFDVVFSSNVLEHIDNLEKIQDETKRVLKPGGIAIHVLTTPSWRFWTSLTNYVYIMRLLTNYMGNIFYKTNNSLSPLYEKNEFNKKIGNYGLKRKIIRLLIPPMQGVRGNVLTEMFYFSRFFWLPFFARTGWNVEKYFPNRVLYTDFVVFGPKLSLKKRKTLSFFLGSSCIIYILKNNGNTK